MLHCFAPALVCGLLFLSGTLHAAEGYFDSKGVKIHYIVEGKGEPVVLIHGFLGDIQLQWGLTGVLKTLVKDYRVIALDCRGHGKSGKPRDPKKYGTEMVEDVVRLLDHLKIPKAHVVGYSMGAVIAGKLLAMHPDRVLSAVLGGGGPIRQGQDMRFFERFIDDLANSLDKGKGIGPLLTLLTPAGQSKPAEKDMQMLNVLLADKDTKALAAVVRGWKALKVTDEQLKANRVPALALVGEMDPLKKLVVDNFKGQMKNLQVEVIEGGNHITTFFKPEFAADIKKFLDEHRGSKVKKAPAGAGK
jgi:pimeloyl-ACP methyl ester carboxylesterase